MPDKLLAIGAVLEDLGQPVVSVRSGADALRATLGQDFAVILLDVNMPDLDGFETAALIRQRKQLRTHADHFPDGFSRRPFRRAGIPVAAPSISS